MRDLDISPLDHDIELSESSAIDCEKGQTQLVYKLGSGSGSVFINKIEARRIGEWFLKLSKELSTRKGSE